MKVFFVNTNKQWGGGEKWHIENALSLKKRGFDVAILTFYESELFKRSVALGLATLPVRISNLSFLNPFSLLKLIRLFKKEKPDTLILNFSSDVKAAGIAAYLAGINNIIYRRGNAKPIKNSFLNRRLYKKVITRIIANSEETKRAILQNNANLFPANKIQVIYNGIDIEQYDSDRADTLYTKKSNEIVIGSAGRLSSEKGHMALVNASIYLKNKKLNFICLIAGEGPEENKLKQAVKDACLEDQIIFPGFVYNMKAFISSLDIFVLPSLWEGFGFVTIEAMAGSKPVVAFRVGSNPEIITDHITGFLADENNLVDLTDKIETLICDRELRDAFGRAGRKRAEDVFNATRSVQELERFLLSL